MMIAQAGGTDPIQLFANIATVGSCLFAAWAAYEARRAASASLAAAEGQLVKEFMDEYSDPSMAEALRALRDWAKEHGPNFASEWLDLFKKGDARAKDIDTARRKVTKYFDKTARLYRARCVGSVALKEMAYVHGINLFYDIVISLDKAMQPNYDMRSHDILRKVVGHYELPDPNA